MMYPIDDISISLRPLVFPNQENIIIQSLSVSSSLIFTYFITRYERVTIQYEGGHTQYNAHWNETISELKKNVSDKVGLCMDCVVELNDKKVDDDKKLFQVVLFDKKVTPVLHLVER